jgi:hypothetical protein
VAEKVKSEQKLLNFKENIFTILHGHNSDKEKLKGKFFHLADTPEFMKILGLTGDYFSVKYGVISRHLGKDKEHDLSEDNWNELTDEIIRPFAIAKYGKGFRLFTSSKTIKGKYIAVGVDVKTIGRGLKVNSICTAFIYNQRDKEREILIYKTKKITPEQTALLDGLNSLSLPPVQGSTSNINQTE